MHHSIQLIKPTSSRKTSPVTWPNDNKAIGTRLSAPKANLALSRSILARCLAFPLFLLRAGLARVNPCAGTPLVFEEAGRLGNSRGLHTETSFSN
jgi:hypothetical protein